MIVPLPKQYQEVISRNHGLHRYLNSLSRDKEYTERSWLYDGKFGSPKKDPDQILTEWCEQLESLANAGTFERRVYDFDISQKEKWGPQGGHEPLRDLVESVVQPSFTPPQISVSPAAFKTEQWEAAIADCILQFRKARVRNLSPRSYERVLDEIHLKGTDISNAGWPDFQRRNIPAVKQKALEDAKSGAWETYPAILLFRRYRGKTRQVWMFPMSANIVEASWFQPIEAAILKSDLADTFYSPWKGFEAVRRSVTLAYGDGYQIAASDFSSTDAHFQLAASNEVLKVLRATFKPQFAEELTRSVQHMHRIPLVISAKTMMVGEHGVASGSNWTNFVETVFDNILSFYVKRLLVSVVGCYGIGDDMSWISKRFNDQFRQQLDEIGTSVGQVIKAEKTMCEPDYVKSLQRLFQRGYKQQDSDLLRGVYSTVRALNSSVYPERSHKDQKAWNSDMFCARQFMILENCCDHPLFREFVAFICKGDPRLSSFARKSASTLDRITREAKLIPGLNPTYNQEKKETSLSQFKSIQVARELG